MKFSFTYLVKKLPSISSHSFSLNFSHTSSINSLYFFFLSSYSFTNMILGINLLTILLWYADAAVSLPSDSKSIGVLPKISPF